MAAAEPRVAVTAPPGYTALAVKFGARQRSPHYLLVKEHRVREGPADTHPPQRTLFVLNVPPYCSPCCCCSLRSPCLCSCFISGCRS
uniref:Uncharacterized protein n=1 Tax=Coturnix japonica TaxID=93934 RepID=A0A8C2T9I7_COTJA